MLYSTVGIIIAIGYLPQIYRLAKSTLPCHEISLPAWVIWTYTSAISLLYSLYGQESVDMKFVSVNTINLTFIIAIIVITIYKRRKYEQKTPIIDKIKNDINNVI